MAGKSYSVYEDDEDMEGPFPLDEEAVEQLDEEAYGVYLLVHQGKGGKTIVCYVGRGVIKERMTAHLTDSDCIAFYAKTVRSELRAFREECRLFHKYGKRSYLDNRIHPARPRGRTDLPPCSEDGCSGEPD